MSYEVYVSGLDMTDWIREEPILINRKGGIGELIEIQSLSLIGDNTKNIWSPGHPNSILDDAFVGDSVTIYKDSELIFEGEIRNISISNTGRDANIALTSKINTILNTYLPYFISEIKTLAEISQDIYTQFGIATDTASYTRAKEKQEDLLLQCVANVRATTNMTVLSAQQWLANAGLCRHYFIGNTAYMEFVDPDETVTLLTTFTDEDILNVSDYTFLEINNYNGYEVITATGTESLSGSNNAPILDANSDKPFVFTTPGSGYNWGDNYIALTSRNQFKITFQLTESNNYANWLTLNSLIGIQSDNFGINKNVEIISIDDSPLLGPIVEGLTL